MLLVEFGVLLFLAELPSKTKTKEKSKTTKLAS
jgi:hypothetical protein